MTTRCRNTQLLDPCECDDLEVGDPSASLATEEGGALALTIGVTEYSVPFTVDKLAATYDFIESDVVSTDDDFLSIVPTMVERTIHGFTLQLDSNPDTSHYSFNWKVRLTSV